MVWSCEARRAWTHVGIPRHTNILINIKFLNDAGIFMVRSRVGSAWFLEDTLPSDSDMDCWVEVPVGSIVCNNTGQCGDCGCVRWQTDTECVENVCLVNLGFSPGSLWCYINSSFGEAGVRPFLQIARMPIFSMWWASYKAVLYICTMQWNKINRYNKILKVKTSSLCNAHSEN